MRRSLAILILLIPGFATAQLSVHIGARLGGPAYLHAEPYDDRENQLRSVPLIAPGVELHYGFTPMLSLGAYYYHHNAERSGFIFSSYHAHSRVSLYGIRSDFTLHSNRTSKMHFVLGLAAERTVHKVDWKHRIQSSFFGSIPESAAGTDEAAAYRIGLSPGMRINTDIKLVFEVSLAVYYNWLESFGRAVDYNSFYPETFADKKGDLNRTTAELRVSIGYSFW